MKKIAILALLITDMGLYTPVFAGGTEGHP